MANKRETCVPADSSSRNGEQPQIYDMTDWDVTKLLLTAVGKTITGLNKRQGVWSGMMSACGQEGDGREQVKISLTHPIFCIRRGRLN